MHTVSENNYMILQYLMQISIGKISRLVFTFCLENVINLFASNCFGIENNQYGLCNLYTRVAYTIITNFFIFSVEKKIFVNYKYSYEGQK